MSLIVVAVLTVGAVQQPPQNPYGVVSAAKLAELKDAIDVAKRDRDDCDERLDLLAPLWEGTDEFEDAWWFLTWTITPDLSLAETHYNNSMAYFAAGDIADAQSTFNSAWTVLTSVQSDLVDLDFDISQMEE